MKETKGKGELRWKVLIKQTLKKYVLAQRFVNKGIAAISFSTQNVYKWISGSSLMFSAQVLKVSNGEGKTKGRKNKKKEKIENSKFFHLCRKCTVFSQPIKPLTFFLFFNGCITVIHLSL